MKVWKLKKKRKKKADIISENFTVNQSMFNVDIIYSLNKNFIKCE